MALIICISVFVLILVFLFIYGGLRETLGEFLIKILPENHTKKGEKVEIFLNRKHNRTATITRISDDKIYIFGTLPLPLDYRGRFYGIGVDQCDGSRLVYLGNRKHYRFVRLAEIMRKAFAVMDEIKNLPIDPSDEEEGVTESQESEVGDDL